MVVSRYWACCRWPQWSNASGYEGVEVALVGGRRPPHVLAEEALGPGRGPPPERVRVVAGVGLGEPQAEERLDEVRARPRLPGVDAVEQRGPAGGLGLLGPEAADPGLAEEVVAGEELVRSLAGENHLEAILAHEAGQQEHRRRGRPHQRGLRVPDHLREHRADVGVRSVHHVVLGPQGLGHGELEAALVVVAHR